MNTPPWQRAAYLPADLQMESLLEWVAIRFGKLSSAWTIPELQAVLRVN